MRAIIILAVLLGGCAGTPMSFYNDGRRPNPEADKYQCTRENTNRQMDDMGATYNETNSALVNSCMRARDYRIAPTQGG
jgi:hypothetical protein